LTKIRHWQVIEGDYTVAPDWQAHWFVDPPYQRAGHKYKGKTPGPAEYAAIAEWCRNRPGFVQVCENDDATWLPFKPFVSVRGMKKTSMEALCEFTN